MRLRDLAGSGIACHLIVYWGVWKADPFGVVERAFLKDLVDLRLRVEGSLQVPAVVEIVFTDTHALLNNVDQGLIDRAQDALRAALPVGFQVTAMSSLLEDEDGAGSTASWPDFPGSQRILAQLVHQATKTFGANLAEARATAYLAANLRESPRVLARWPTGIFLHIGPPELRPLLPSLPILYGYSSRRGTTRKPWFFLG